MYIRWLGNSCLEIKANRNILIDPNYKIKPESIPDILLITHEHDDHFSPKSREKYPGANLYAPKTTIKKHSINGTAVKGDETIEQGIKVLRCNCYNTEDAVAYFYKGLLHTADTSQFTVPEKNVKILFTACFKDKYENYLEACHRIDPKIVVPYHYNPESEKERKEAEDLIELVRKEGFYARPLDIGEKILI